MKIQQSLTFDDVLLKPNYSSVVPSEVDTKTSLTSKIGLTIPLISSAMDTVTEYKLAIAMAQAGGLGVIHKNMNIEDHVKQIANVKKFESGMVVNPITISPNVFISDAINTMKINKISGIPVVNEITKKLEGIITNRDVRFISNQKDTVAKYMTSDVIKTNKNIKPEEAKKLLHKYRIEKLVVVDKNDYCIGLITVKDIEKANTNPFATKDEIGRLRVGAAIGVGDHEIERALELEKAGADILFIDTAHGHSKSVLEMVSKTKKRINIDIVVGNIATTEAALSLIDSGANAVKVGIGPGSICTTRIVAGIGVPQLTAILDVCSIAKKKNIPVIADGGIKFSGDLAKAIAAGASVAMVGSLFAGTDETPGEVFLKQGLPYKYYRGMGSTPAMAAGSADRYFQSDIRNNLKLVPEGIEGSVTYKGPVRNVINQLVGGLKASMGYTGNKNIKEMQQNCEFIKITNAGLRESHVHDVNIIRQPSNYNQDK